MARDPHELYKGATLHKIFAIASILFLLGVVWMVLADHTREWKQFQRKFEAYEREQTEKEIERAGRKIDEKKLAELKDALTKQEAVSATNKAAVSAVQDELKTLDTEMFKVKQSYQIAKSYFDSNKYAYEEAGAHGHVSEDLKTRFETTGKETDALKAELDRLEFKQASLQAKLLSFAEAEDNIKKEMTKLTRDRDLLEKSLKNLKPSFAKAILNAPMLDFIQPTLKIRQIVTEDLFDDYHFAKVPKVDRCTTCHTAIDKPKGYAKAPAPFQSHPNLDLFLGANSKHPINEFGCTVCHGGSGQDVSFVGSAHTPRNEEQKKEWIEKYGWKERHYWEHPMLPLDRVEANCVKCHDQVQELPQAPKINQGRRLFRELGCFGCHETKGFEGLREVGPSLKRLHDKTDRGWAFNWIKNPLSYNPYTRMPRFFGLSNAADSDRENVEVDAIVTYLFHAAEEPKTEKPEPRGDGDKGKKLLESVGCLGCHSIGDQAANEFGPNLSWVGTKVNRAWLVEWLKNPKQHWAKTRMPDLRLSDEEALDIAEYLMSLKNVEFEQLAEPIIKPDVLKEAALYELELQMTKDQAAEKISAMDDQAKKLYLGERIISRYGCYGCHEIAGFENAKPIGTSLTEEGDKPVARFDFGLIKMEHSREAWFIQKLKDPRIFDHGKVKRHEERLRMPKFNVTDEEIQSIVTHLTSLTKSDIPLSKKHVLDAREQHVEQGWRLVRNFNCQGCHIVGGEGGRILDLYQDKSLGPPNITGEGQKVQSNWLFNFLRHPTTIRPWLNVRMPTFNFTDEEASALVKFFHGLDGTEDGFTADDAAPPSAEQLSAGKHIFEALQCIKCHRFTEGMVLDESVDVSTLAPNLYMAHDRLRSEWIVDWLKDPEALMPGTRMPSFWPDEISPAPEILNGDAVLQRQAVRDYVLSMKNESSAPSQ